MMDYIKSPMNYIGNKYRILPQIQRWFPKDINTMVDIFSGGCDVIINTMANKKIANDINYYVIQIFQEFQKRSPEEIIQYIDNTIEKWQLSKTNKQGYEDFRNYYNANPQPLDLYVLMCYSFNYQFRFNSKHEYNNPFGKDRSSFNERMRENLRRLLHNLEDIEFVSKDFAEFDYEILKEGDFIYADPPYLITCGSYNDGKRGFKGWNSEDDTKLFEILDCLNDRGVKFALSNVAEHKGLKNEKMIDWQETGGYQLHNVMFDYNNCNYQANNKHNKTVEVLITNY